jgi:hypothetical protein
LYAKTHAPVVKAQTRKIATERKNLPKAKSIHIKLTH